MARERAKLVEARFERNLTAQQVAKSIGVTTSMVLQMERGTKMCSAKTLKRLAKCFNVTMDEMYNIMGM